ncbi:MAG: ECF transporter S component [Bacilli bacterium]|nr:ECF transporter S component [Bacilli bacterium]
MNDNITGLFIVVAFVVVFLAKFLAKFFFKGNVMTTRFIARTAVFAAISIILYTVPFLKFSLPIFPAFLEIHLDEIPAFIAGFAYGPLSGALVILVKTIVKLPLTNTACVGEFADFIYSMVFVIPAAIIYKRHRTIKGAFISMGVATIIQIMTASFVTTFVMLDAYSKLYHLPKAVILGMCQKINPAITSLGFPFLLMVALPFNALKDAIVVILTFLLYKRLRILFSRIDAQKN